MVRFLAITLLATLAGASTVSAFAQSAPSAAATVPWPTLTVQNSGTANQLIGISPVSESVAWASGAGGTYTRTTDGGKTWKAGVVPGAEALQFRDVQGISDKVAYLLSIGNNPTDFRIYKTEDGGKHWSLQFENQLPGAFYDCFAFWTPNRGIAISDSVNGRFPDIKTRDGGENWFDIGDHLPKAEPGEASFSSSGTCVATHGSSHAWIATGGSKNAHIYATNDSGNTWTRNNVPTVQGTPSSGVFSVAFRDRWHGIEGAGELASPTTHQKNIARSCDGGRNWELTRGTPFVGAVYGLAYANTTRLLPDVESSAAEAGESSRSACKQYSEGPQQWRTVVATGPGGAAWSATEGEGWHLLPGVTNYWGVSFASPKAGWFVGTGGRILKISF